MAYINGKEILFSAILNGESAGYGRVGDFATVFVREDGAEGAYFTAEEGNATIVFYGTAGDESVTLRNIAAPVKEWDAANKKYVDAIVYDWAKQPEKPTYTAAEVGAEGKGAVSSAVVAHNTNPMAHNDIRVLITELTSRLNALANSDDTTLDQMAEIVAYIKANRDLIEQITTGKVSTSDIVNNLTTNVSTKPLSAAQGVALKALIDAIIVPTKTSQLTNDSKFLTAVPSEYITETELNNKGYAVKSSAETWTFTLEDGSTITKKVVLG